MDKLLHWIKQKFGYNTHQNDYYEPLAPPVDYVIKIIDKPKRNKIKVKRKHYG